MPLPYNPINMQSLMSGPQQQQPDPRLVMAALAKAQQLRGQQPSPWVNNFLTGPGNSGGAGANPYDSTSSTSPPNPGVRQEGQGGPNAMGMPTQSPAGMGGQRPPNSPIPGLPQPAMTQSRSTSVGVPDGNPMTSRTGTSTGMPDPGMPPGTSGNSAKVAFGFGDDLTTPQLQAIQKALTDMLQGQHQTNQAYQDSKKKKSGGLGRASGMGGSGQATMGRPGMQTGTQVNMGGNQGMSPFPVPQSSPNDPWTGPSSR